MMLARALPPVAMTCVASLPANASCAPLSSLDASVTELAAATPVRFTCARVPRPTPAVPPPARTSSARLPVCRMRVSTSAERAAVSALASADPPMEVTCRASLPDSATSALRTSVASSSTLLAVARPGICSDPVPSNTSALAPNAAMSAARLPCMVSRLAAIGCVPVPLAARIMLAVVAPPSAWTNPVTWLPSTYSCDWRTSMAATPIPLAWAVLIRSIRMPALARAEPLAPLAMTGAEDLLPCTAIWLLASTCVPALFLCHPSPVSMDSCALARQGSRATVKPSSHSTADSRWCLLRVMCTRSPFFLTNERRIEMGWIERTASGRTAEIIGSSGLRPAGRHGTRRPGCSCPSL